MQNAVLILSQETNERTVEESLLRLATCKSLSFHFSFSHSLALLSWSLTLLFSASLSFTQSVPLFNSIYPPFLPPSFLLSFFPSFFLSFFFCLSLISFPFSHSQAPSGSDSLNISLSHFLILCIFLFSFIVPLSLSFSHPLTHLIRLTSSLPLYSSRTTHAQHHHTE